MFCKWCGLESNTSDVCSWCQHPLSAGVSEETEKSVGETSTREIPSKQTIGFDDFDSAPVLIGKANDIDDAPEQTTPTPAEPAPSTPPAPTKSADTAPVIAPLGLKRPGSQAPPPPLAPLSRPQPTQAKAQTPTPLPKAATPPAQPRKPLAPPHPEGDDIPLKIKTPQQPVSLNREVAPEVQKLKPLSEATEDDVVAAVPMEGGRIHDLDAPVSPTPVAPPPPPRKSTVPKAGGRTWYCRWCGMQSDSPDKCSWCNKDLRNMPPIPGGAPPKDRVNGNTNDKPNGSVDTLADTDEGKDKLALENPWIQVGYYAACMVVFAIVIGAIGTTLKESVAGYLALLGISNFVAGLAVPLFRVGPFGEDDSSDIGIGLPLMLLFGPFAGGLIYAVKGVITQDVNPSVAAIFASGFVMWFTLILATGHALTTVMPFNDRSLVGFAAQCMTVAAVIGWYAAGVFHKFDE